MLCYIFLMSLRKNHLDVKGEASKFSLKQDFERASLEFSLASEKLDFLKHPFNLGQKAEPKV